jgi:hypothetical protein
MKALTTNRVFFSLHSVGGECSEIKLTVPPQEVEPVREKIESVFHRRGVLSKYGQDGRQGNEQQSEIQ